MISLSRSQVRIPLLGALATFAFLAVLAIVTRALVHDLTYRDIDDELETLSVAIASDLEVEGLARVEAEALHTGVEQNMFAFRLEHHAALLVDGNRLVASSGDLARRASIGEAAEIRRRPEGTFTESEPFTGQHRKCRFRVAHLSGKAQGATLIVFRSIEPTLRTLRRIDIALLLVVVIGTLGSGAIVAVAVRRSLRPVEEVTRIAETAQATDLSRRVTSRGGGEELQHLVSVINSLFERLERAFESQRRLVADAAHELKTPVAAIVAEAQEARREDTEEEQRNALLDSIVASARSLARETNDLLTLARGEASQVERRRVDLREVVENARSVLDNTMRERAMTLAVTADERAVVDGEEASLRRLVANLLSNAVRYSRDGADLFVRLTNGATGVSLAIGDRGPGVDAADRERIFDRFVRLPSARATNPDGSGLGLAIVAQVARNHGATIEVADREGGGAIFTVTFPT